MAVLLDLLFTKNKLYDVYSISCIQLICCDFLSLFLVTSERGQPYNPCGFVTDYIYSDSDIIYISIY